MLKTPIPQTVRFQFLDDDVHSGESSGMGWWVACWAVALLGALGGLIYSRYQARFSASGLLDMLAAMEQAARALWVAVSAGEVARLPWMLAAVAAVAVLALLWTLHREFRRRRRVALRRAWQTDNALAELLAALGDLTGGNPATGEVATQDATAPEDTDGAPHPPLTAQWQASNNAQKREISSAAREIAEVVAAFGRLSEAAAKSTERARHCADVAEKGATTAGGAVAGMNAVDQRLQDSIERLKRMVEGARRVDDTVDLLKRAAEDAHLLSLNVCIQAAPNGASGRANATALDARQLAERLARASSEISAVMEQAPAGGAIAALESAAGEVSADVALAAEAAHALAEIEGASRELLAMNAATASEADSQSASVATLVARIGKLEAAAAQADASVSEIAVALQAMQSAASKLARLIAAPAPPNP